MDLIPNRLMGFLYLRPMRLFRHLFAVLVLLSLAFSSFAPAPHPYYVSVTDIRIDTEKRTAGISCKMFTDDLEEAMRTLYKHPVELLKRSSAVDSLLALYVTERLEISVGDKEIDYKFLGYEIEEESTWCYFEGDVLSGEKKVRVSASILYDFLKEQTNFVHCHYNGERKSFKLENPNRDTEFAF